MSKVGKVVIESLVVLAVGVGLAFVANAKSNHGLTLNRNYFEVRNVAIPAPPPGPGPGTGPSGTQPADSGSGGTSSSGSGTPDQKIVDATKKAIEAAGFKPIEYTDLLKLYETESQSRGNAYVFIDAREQAQYIDGHIPLAYHIDPSANPEQIAQFAQSMPLQVLLPSAERIIFYCHGGRCEDSLIVARNMRDFGGMDPTKVYVYVGGYEEWVAKHQPEEKGEHGSGVISTGGGQ